MKTILSGLFFLCFSMSAVFAQVNPVKWSYTFEKIDDATYELTFIAQVDDGWYVYSQFLEDDGPIPTSLNFDENTTVSLLGEAEEEGKKKQGFDNMFQMELTKYSSKMVLKQKIKVSDTPESVKGYLEYMTCNDSQCLPPTAVDFEFELK